MYQKHCIAHAFRSLDHVYVFLCMVLLAVKMVSDVTEARNVIPSLEFKTCMTIKS